MSSRAEIDSCHIRLLVCIELGVMSSLIERIRFEIDYLPRNSYRGEKISMPRTVTHMIQCDNIQNLLKSIRLLRTDKSSVLKGMIREVILTFNESLHPASVDEKEIWMPISIQNTLKFYKTCTEGKSVCDYIDAEMTIRISVSESRDVWKK